MTKDMDFLEKFYEIFSSCTANRACNNDIANTKKLLINSMIVDNAFTVGDIPDRIMVKTYNDNVCADDPAQKNEITKSSKETIMTSSVETNIAGYKKGITM